MSDALQSTIEFQNSETRFRTSSLIGSKPVANYGDWLKARNPRRKNNGYGGTSAAGIRNTEPRKLSETENEAGKHRDRNKQPRPETENAAGNQSPHNSSNDFSNWNGRGVRTAGSQRGQNSTVNTENLSEEEEGEGQVKEKASTEKEKGKGKEKIVLEIGANQGIAKEGFLNTNEDGPHHSFDHDAVTNAVAGLAADGRQIVSRTKSEATNYERLYGEPIPVKELADRVASFVHLCTLYWWLRPFGCGVILGGYDRDGPQLYMVEPSGVSYRYFGAAIGKGRQAAKTEIEKLKLSEMTCRQGVIEVAKIIYGVHDEAKDKAFELEMSWVCDESNRLHQKVPEELLESAKVAAKAALEEMDAD